jgi:hypothetical protein
MLHDELRRLAGQPWIYLAVDLLHADRSVADYGGRGKDALTTFLAAGSIPRVVKRRGVGVLRPTEMR